MSGPKHPGPKCQGAKRPGPKCQGLNVQVPKSQGAKRPVTNRLSAKILPESSLHDCEASSMIVTLHEASL